MTTLEDDRLLGRRQNDRPPHRSSIVWRCHEDGWKIVREHNSGMTITPAETDQLLNPHR
jgi:hypothetical protein